MTRSALFDAVRPFVPPPGFTSGDIAVLDTLADKWGIPRLDADPLTVRVALELLEHEAVVQEAYLDSVKVWTWAVGITKASGIDVARYKDNPQPMATCLAAYADRLRKVYVPDVLKAFAGREITEAQFAAALSFHYNTGAIKRASWVGLWLNGKVSAARASFMEWRKPAAIIKRRQAECDLFFDGEWAQTGMVTVYPVRKPSYQPDFAKGKRVDVRADLAAALA